MGGGTRDEGIGREDRGREDRGREDRGRERGGGWKKWKKGEVKIHHNFSCDYAGRDP